MKYLLAIFLLLNILVCSAAIYEQVDRQGRVIYSDQPLYPKAKRIDLPETETKPASTTAVTQPTTTESSATPAVAAQAQPTQHTYTLFAIESPKEKETFQNQRTIPVVIKIDPELQKGDMVQLFLDGQQWGVPRHSIHLDLPQVERGEHQVSAILVDENRQVLKQSQSVTIFVHLASVQSPIRKPSQ